MSDASDPLLDDDDPDDPAAVERRVDELLTSAFAGRGDIFDGADSPRLTLSKRAGDRLVELKLARFTDEGRTRIDVTNAGRYWALNGGYMGFLKEVPPGGGGGGRNQSPEFQALRMTYMKLRLNTFWLTFGLSIAGFVISLISIAIAVLTGERLPLR
jgi:hypothetical protein